MPQDHGAPRPTTVALRTVCREWTRIGCIGFGGPPTHVAMLRRLCVDERHWLTAQEFEEGVTATSLLPGPASTQLAIFCAWRLRGAVGAIVGGLGFILPGLFLILLLAAALLTNRPPGWVLGAAGGAGAAVPAVAVRAAHELVPASWQRIGPRRSDRARWLIYGLLGAAAAAAWGPYLVLVLLGCALAEVVIRNEGTRGSSRSVSAVALGLGHTAAVGGLAALAWVAFKVGALSYGGGFVIVPLIQHDAVNAYHLMTASQFLNAVALGQLTPGPVVQTIAVVGYAAGGVGGGLLAALVAFAPSFLFVLVGGPRFDQLRCNRSVQSFLTGAGPAVTGAIAGSSIPLGLSLQHLWQIAVLGFAAAWFLVIRRGVVSGLLVAGTVGTVLAVAGAPV
ncbi:MAG: chromate transporter [Candidatus Dormibacteria bacterium]